MKQVSYGVKENSETLINTDVLLGNTWQHPKIPILKPLNIAEAPKNAASALLGASLGEDKYLIYLSYMWHPIAVARGGNSTSSKEGDPLTSNIITPQIRLYSFLSKKIYNSCHIGYNNKGCRRNNPASLYYERLY